jgi:16S rRNA C1402 (ribose-2'-O) methylase RsmI
VADPGADLIAAAHAHGVRVVPLWALRRLLRSGGFGLNGQSFCFHGYLPVQERPSAGRSWSWKHARAARAYTQIFIETPYRNNQLLEALLAACQPDTRYVFATDLTLPGENRTHAGGGALESCGAGSQSPPERVLAAGRRGRSTHRVRRSRAQQRLGARAPETTREALGDILLRSEVDHLLGLDHVAGDVLDAAQAIGQTELDAFCRSRPVR